MPNFSERHGFEPVSRSTTNREAASDNLREMVINIAEKQLQPSQIRSLICNTLFVAPDSGNWSEYPNIDGECRNLIGSCAWNEVFDIIEEIAKVIDPSNYDTDASREFSRDIDRLFIREGVGWQLKGNEVFARGSEAFNRMTEQVTNELQGKHANTATSEIHEALKDISRRPKPDKTGAIHHAMGAIECFARSISGDEKSTLGEIVKAKSKLHGIPAPLDEAVSKMWGYASERARHIREGNEPSFEEAELIVTVSAAICIYLSKKGM